MCVEREKRGYVSVYPLSVCAGICVCEHLCVCVCVCANRGSRLIWLVIVALAVYYSSPRFSGRGERETLGSCPRKRAVSSAMVKNTVGFLHKVCVSPRLLWIGVVPCSVTSMGCVCVSVCVFVCVRPCSVSVIVCVCVCVYKALGDNDRAPRVELMVLKVNYGPAELSVLSDTQRACQEPLNESCFL